MDNTVMFKLTYGLFVLTAADDKKANGCIINTAIQQTAEPNRVSITVNKQNYTEGLIQKSGKFNLSFIDESAEFSLFQHFGFRSGRDADKFADLDKAAYETAANGIPYIKKGCNAFMSLKVEQTIDLGSHTLFIAHVEDGENLSKNASMSYAFYHANVKPKPQEVKSKGKVWVCKICGYVYDEDKEGVAFEDLPADWTCPWCKHGKQDFELQK
ncbi:MAG: flavin reductase [Lachnospiraceae bacterium]|nr:flavin reductase [Lachnospiraceae bacterium]